MTQSRQLNSDKIVVTGTGTQRAEAENFALCRNVPERHRMRRAKQTIDTNHASE
jgi:hypothetical protein